MNGFQRRYIDHHGARTLEAPKHRSDCGVFGDDPRTFSAGHIATTAPGSAWCHEHCTCKAFRCGYCGFHFNTLDYLAVTTWPAVDCGIKPPQLCRVCEESGAIGLYEHPDFDAIAVQAFICNVVLDAVEGR